MHRKQQLEARWERETCVRTRPKPRFESGERLKVNLTSPTTSLALAQSRIRALTTELRGPVVEAGIVYHAQVGATVLAHVYGGKLDAWRARAKRDSSVSELAEELSDLLPQSFLYRSLSIYEVLLRHAARFPAIRNLGVRALAAIARAPDQAQVGLIERALEGRWSGTQLENEVRELPKRNNGGRPRKAVLSKALDQLVRTLAVLESAPLDELDPSALRKAANEAYAFAEAFDRVLVRLEKAARAAR